MPISSVLEITSTTIDDEETTSAAVSLGGGTAVGLELPTLTAATLSFETLAADGVTWKAVYKDDGTVYTVTVVDGAYVGLDPIWMVGLSHFRIVGNTAETSGPVTIYVRYRGV